VPTIGRMPSRLLRDVACSKSNCVDLQKTRGSKLLILMYRENRQRSRVKNTAQRTDFFGTFQHFLQRAAGSVGLRLPRAAECCRLHPNFEVGNL
jgi:hypothetical protein